MSSPACLTILARNPERLAGGHNPIVRPIYLLLVVDQLPPALFMLVRILVREIVSRPFTPASFCSAREEQIATLPLPTARNAFKWPYFQIDAQG